MKTKGLIFVSCLAAGALIASPAMGKPAKNSSMSKSKRTAPQRTQVNSNYRHNQNISSRMGSTRYYGGTRYSGTRSYAGRQYAGTRYYGDTRYYGNYNGGGTRSYYGGYPYRGYNNNYSYYTPTYGYNASMVAAVQRRLGQLGYYHGAVDGVIGPQTSGAIAAFESRNGLAVDGTISRPLLNTLGLA